MIATLHHERIAATGAAPARWLLLTHGIYGSGMNWRGIARQIHARRPAWGCVLVDLRHHGKSDAGTPPDDLAACAHDLAALIASLAGQGTRIAALAGHSFGGKVVLATRALAATGEVPASALRQTWMLDSSPSARPGAEDDPANTVEQVLRTLEQLPPTFASRDAFVAAVRAAGQAEPLARWLAMNLVETDRGYINRLDLRAVRALLADYYARDLWSIVDDDALPGDVELVIADRSNVFTAADRGRAAASPANVHVHHVDAGHWLHIEAPAAVAELFAHHLPA